MYATDGCTSFLEIIYCAFSIMLLEVFEIRGTTEPDVDDLLLKLHRKFSDVVIRKIDALDEKSMSSEDEIKNILRSSGTAILPLFRLDGKIVEKAVLEEMLFK